MDNRPNKPLGGLSHRLVEPQCSSLIHRPLGKPKTLRNTIVKHCYVVRYVRERLPGRRTLQLCYLPVNLRLYGKHHHHGPRNFQSVVPKVDSDITSGFVYVSQKLQIIATAGAAQVKKRARRKRGLGKSKTTSFHDYSQRLEIAPSILSESLESLLVRDDILSRHFPLPTKFLRVQLCFPRNHRSDIADLTPLRIGCLKALASGWWLRIGRTRGGSSSVLANEGSFSSRISAVLAFDCRHWRHVWEMCRAALKEWEMGWARDADGMRRPRIDGCLSPSTIEGGR
ncbi:hypothetical protein ALC53_04722 [Atta colombica]|uniref:Uncharacterized protein n=1 Tax=Atta colombica TaxID=520822 RepID=A0A195BL32_9HYME|nr:hypothetical protein ALC53_04722 [Atta colombica]